MKKQTLDEIREIVRSHWATQEWMLSDEQIEEIAVDLEERQEEVFDTFLKAEVRQTLMEMVARGEAEYDPETDEFRLKRD